jgi:hypothetical protein
MRPVETQLPASFPVDFGTLFEFGDNHTGEAFGVSLATLLQCLCITEQRYLVPPLDSAWEALAIPPVLRAMSSIQTT